MFSFRPLNQLVLREAYEPTLFWGLRLALASVLPIVWGVSTGRLHDAEWMALIAESMCWIELKGSVSQRIRLIFAAAFVALLFGLLGALVAPYLWWSVLLMLAVGFFSSLFRNLGDRGSGLAFCINIMFIISNSSPISGQEEFLHRLSLLAIGGGGTIVISLLFFVFQPTQQPYRRSVALVLKAIHDLSMSVRMGWDGKQPRNNLHDIYKAELRVRYAMNSSFHFFENLAQDDAKDDTKNALAKVRKASSLVASHIISIAGELENVVIKEVHPEVRSLTFGLLNAFSQVTDRLSVFVLHHKSEDELLVRTRIERIHKLLQFSEEVAHLAKDEMAFKRIMVLAGRISKLLEHAVEQMKVGTKDVSTFRSYSFLKTIFILHPRYFVRNFKSLYHFNSFSTKYALRLAVAGAFGTLVWKFFDINYGYWIPFTVIIVVQPFFGATFKKGVDRVIGTVLGGIAGGLIIQIPAHYHLKEIFLFIASILMVYYVRVRYSIAAFFVTVSLVLLFEVGHTANPLLIIDRGENTFIGALIAIVISFAFVPTWDKVYLPRHLNKAIRRNFDYFNKVFLKSQNADNWILFKRQAETANGNAFESFNRYVNEPSTGKKLQKLYYQIVMHNTRLSRELTAIQLDWPDEEEEFDESFSEYDERILMAQDLFHDCLSLLLPEKSTDNLPHEDKGLKLEFDHQHSPKFLNENQKFHLERIIVELKALKIDLEIDRNIHKRL